MLSPATWAPGGPTRTVQWGIEPHGAGDLRSRYLGPANVPLGPPDAEGGVVYVGYLSGAIGYLSDTCRIPAGWSWCEVSEDFDLLVELIAHVLADR